MGEWGDGPTAKGGEGRYQHREKQHLIVEMQGQVGEKTHHDTGMAHPQTQALPPASWMLLLNSITPGDGIT